MRRERDEGDGTLNTESAQFCPLFSDAMLHRSQISPRARVDTPPLRPRCCSGTNDAARVYTRESANFIHLDGGRGRGWGGMALSILAGFFNPSKQASTPMACLVPLPFPDFTPILVKLAIVTYFRCKSFAKQALSLSLSRARPISRVR